MGGGSKGYEFFEHTADVGVRAYGDTLEALFRHTAQGVVALLVENSRIAPHETRPIALSASSVESLLQAWLTELLVWFDAERFVPSAYQFDVVSETSLRGQISGERFDPARHTAGVEVKGVTRHGFAVARGPQRWEATIIVDV